MMDPLAAERGSRPLPEQPGDISKDGHEVVLIFAEIELVGHSWTTQRAFDELAGALRAEVQAFEVGCVVDQAGLVGDIDLLNQFVELVEVVGVGVQFYVGGGVLGGENMNLNNIPSFLRSEGSSTHITREVDHRFTLPT